MTRARYAATMPGRIGDALYSLPFIRYIYGQTGEKIDFYTSEYCLPMRTLFEYQHCINSFNIAPNYKIERHDMGTQPFYMEVPEEYEHVFQLGFQRVPDRAIHQFIAHEQDVDIGLGIRYDCPNTEHPELPADYICIAPRGETSFKQLFNDVASVTNAVIIGGAGDYTDVGIDYTGIPLLETTAVLARARGFVGLMSSQLVLANGFDIPRIGVNGYQSDMRHAIFTEHNHYSPEGSTADDILEILNRE